MPPLQSVEEQSRPLAQAKPFGWGPHVPSTQTLDAHAAALVQGFPLTFPTHTSAAHAADAHSLSRAHGAVAGRGSPHSSTGVEMSPPAAVPPSEQYSEVAGNMGPAATSLVVATRTQRPDRQAASSAHVLPFSCGARQMARPVMKPPLLRLPTAHGLPMQKRPDTQSLSAWQTQAPAPLFPTKQSPDGQSLSSVGYAALYNGNVPKKHSPDAHSLPARQAAPPVCGDEAAVGFAAPSPKAQDTETTIRSHAAMALV